jgi:DNA-binding transcriptional ArsR family regulator
VQLSHSLRVVTSALDGDVLEVLARAETSFTGRELARLVGASKEGVRRVLARLVEQGIVTSEPAGAAQMYRLNRDHLAAPAVIALAGLREELLTRLRRELAGWKPPACYGALFGSTARGQERPDSDLDLFLLRPDGIGGDHPGWDAQVTALARTVTGWTGNDTRILQVGLDEIGDVAEPNGVLDDVLRDGIQLTGSETVLRRALRSIRSSR